MVFAILWMRSDREGECAVKDNLKNLKDWKNNIAGKGRIALVLVLVLVLIIGFNCYYNVNEQEQEVVTMFGKVTDVKRVTRKPIIPREEETETNTRARSAKLRVLEKL